jgi:UDP-glucose 4-epimerase
MFVKKSPSATVLTVAHAIKEILNSDAEIKTIGTRHGEKLFETLVTSEEMAHALDHGNYYRIPADTRDLNYASYFSEGMAADAGSYTSHNTHRMSLEETIALLKDWVYGISK